MKEFAIDLNLPKNELISVLKERLLWLRENGLQIQSQPLGFMKIPLNLEQGRTKDGLYLHLWLPNLPTQEGGPYIHTHVFNMESRIITLNGTFFDLQWEEVEDKNGLFNMATATPYEEKSNPDNLGGKSNLVDEKRVTLDEGDVYYVEPDTFHRSEVSGSCLTLVKKFNFKDAPPVLAMSHEQPTKIKPFAHNQINQDEAWNKIFEILK